MRSALAYLVTAGLVGCGCGESELTSCISPTAAHGGECNMIEQCGCPSGSFCFFDWDGYWDPSACQIFEVCTVGDPGTGEIGEECDSPFMWDCRPDLVCIHHVCREWCLTDGDCSRSGTTCRDVVNIDALGFTESACGWGHASSIYGLCTLP